MNTPTKNWFALIGLSLASFLTAIDFAIVNTALPVMQIALSASFLQLQWIMNVYVLVICTLLVTMGRFSDIVGRRCLLYLGIIIFGMTSLLCGVVNNAGYIITGRALQGIGSAIIIPCSLAIVTRIFQGSSQGKALGVWTSINGIGFAIGPVLGGFLTHFLSWRWVFFINIPVVILSLIICLSSLDKAIDRADDSKITEKIDWPGFIYFTLGIACLVSAIIQGPSWGWLNWQNKILFSIAALALLTLCWVEKKAQHPMLKFRLFLNKTFFAGVLANFAIVTFAYVIFFFLPLYLHVIRQENTNQIGMMLLPVTVTMTLVSPLVGHWVDKYGGKFFMLLGLILLFISALAQYCFTTQSFINFILILIATFSMGLAWGVIWGSATHTAIAALPSKDAGLAAGALWTIQNLGGAVGLAIAGALFRAQLIFTVGYAVVMEFLIILCVVLFFTILRFYFFSENTKPL